MQRVLCVIPSRMGSTRLKNKPLSMIGDMPLVAHTYLSATQCKDIDDVVVATDHPQIAEIVTSMGGKAIMTPESLATGSDRVAFVAQDHLHDIVINLQGDEPFMDPEVLSGLVQPFKNNPSLQMATSASPLDWQSDYQSPDLVKVLCDQNNKALYFSRSPIPYLRQDVDPSQLPVYKHMGLYAFRRDFLLTYTNMPQTALEKAESLEQLRALENGVGIHVSLTDFRSCEVNTREELELARQIYQKRQIQTKGRC